MPMIRGCDRDRVNILVLEQLAHVDICLWLGQAQFLHVAETQVQDILVHVAETGYFRSGNVRESFEMIVTAPPQSANCDTHAIIRAQYLSTQSKRCRAQGRCLARRLEEIAPFDWHGLC